MSNLTTREQPNRLHIDMHQAVEVKLWARALGVSKEELRKAIDKVGNSAVSVRKELGIEWSDGDESRDGETGKRRTTREG
ncbi:DUF3606 domain-containing protein [Bradyrhizobium sp. RD5-C2]|uniref:DUF3606 domain-containing protein n=1 Tax=Bradyrhizobium sp. RD5-C2 TaxID=244562 RepID=UPI001CC5DADC|nr:DUF3606 domain-containing protein [Bradyrhizobium sp. RD5-C2]GIQ75373.1 hypothetical protein BraRD5C2_38140 [Bradyrhizobium sp. RD5-C2]